MTDRHLAAGTIVQSPGHDSMITIGLRQISRSSILDQVGRLFAILFFSDDDEFELTVENVNYYSPVFVTSSYGGSVTAYLRNEHKYLIIRD